MSVFEEKRWVVYSKTLDAYMMGASFERKGTDKANSIIFIFGYSFLKTAKEAQETADNMNYISNFFDVQTSKDNQNHVVRDWASDQEFVPPKFQNKFVISRDWSDLEGVDF